MRREIEIQKAFTRVDLVAVVAICVVLGALTLPLRGDAQADAATLVCRTNMRQLVRAAHLYSMDNGGLLALNGDDPTPGRVWVATGIEFPPGTTNSAALQNPTTSLLANYLDRNARPFRCPLTPNTISGGRPLPVARSVSMNLAIGTDPVFPKNPTPGAWLDGAHGHTANRTWRCFSKLSDMVRPIPSDLYMFIEENYDSINDGLFAVVGPGPLAQRHWIDWPAAYHQGAGDFGMADGSALMHRWVAPATVRNNPPSAPGNLSDLTWLSQHTTALITDQP